MTGTKVQVTILPGKLYHLVLVLPNDHVLCPGEHPISQAVASGEVVSSPLLILTATPE